MVRAFNVQFVQQITVVNNIIHNMCILINLGNFQELKYLCLDDLLNKLPNKLAVNHECKHLHAVSYSIKQSG